LGFSRKLLWLCVLLLGLHVCEVLILGTSAAGSLVANSLQTVACGVATAMAYAAARRGRGLSRPFWLLVSAGLGMWGVANLGWMYHENWLHSEVPRLSLTRFLFDTQGVFFAIALSLDKEKDASGFDRETLLDSLQIAIVFFSAFFGMYYVQLLGGANDARVDLFMTWSYEITNVALTLLAAMVTLSSRTQRLQRLYGGLTAFLLINAIASGGAEYMQTVRDVPTGTWYDMGWTLPFLACALWASRWEEPKPEATTGQRLAGKTRRMVVVKNLILALGPLIVLVVAAQLGAEWKGVGFVLLGASITCYAARLGVSEYHEVKAAAAVRRQTVALDSAIDGMAIVSAESTYTYVNAAFANVGVRGAAGDDREALAENGRPRANRAGAQGDTGGIAAARALGWAGDAEAERNGLATRSNDYAAAGWRGGYGLPRHFGPEAGGAVSGGGGGEVSDAGGAGGSDQLHRRGWDGGALAVRQPASGSDIRVLGG
jgi:hypothetical protein